MSYFHEVLLRDKSHDCCPTPTCFCGEPNTTHCYACGKECKTCQVRVDSVKIAADSFRAICGGKTRSKKPSA